MSVAVVVDRAATREELIAIVQREHVLAATAMRTVLVHAMAAGDALLLLQEQVPHGEWKRYVTEHLPLSVSTAQDYMRLAYFRERLASYEDITGVEEALKLLRGMPRKPNGPGRNGLGDGLAKEARRLQRQGFTAKQIESRLGVSPTTVYWWLNPDKKKKYLRELRRTNQLGREQRTRAQEQALARAVRKRGGAIAEAYALAERMQDVLAQAHREEKDREARRSLSLAGEHYRQMRDLIVRALGVSDARGEIDD